MLKEEINRRKFLENKVQKYVKSLITKNESLANFIKDLISTEPQIEVKVKEFMRQAQGREHLENEGESTDNGEHSEEESLNL